MKFLKDNSYDIVKFFIYQIGIAVFSLTLAIPLAAAIENERSDLLAQFGVSALAIVFYCILVYTVSWEHGATDRIRIDSGKATREILKGGKIAFVASLPNFVLAAFAAVAALLYSDGNVWASILGALLAILGLIESMYLGVVNFAVSSLPNPSSTFYFVMAIGYFVMPLVVVFASHLGYLFGDKGIRIFGFATGNKNKRK